MTQEERDDATERVRLATELAYQRGRESARIDGILEQHEARLNTINGSMAKTATRLEAIAFAINKAEAAQEKRDAIHEALQEAVTRASKAQVTSRQFYFGLVGAVVGVLTVLLSVLG